MSLNPLTLNRLSERANSRAAMTIHDIQYIFYVLKSNNIYNFIYSVWRSCKAPRGRTCMDRRLARTKVLEQNVCCANLSWRTPSLAKWRVPFRNTLHNFAQHMCQRVCSWRVGEVTAAQPVFLQFQTTYSFHGLLLSHFGNSYHLPPSPALKMQKLEAEQKCRGQLMAQCGFMIFHASSLFLGIRG